MSYALIMMGPDAPQHAADLAAAFEHSVRDMGLDPAADVQIIIAPGALNQAVARHSALVAVWCGRQLSQDEAEDAAQVQVARTMMARGHPVFPVVETLDAFATKVPCALRVLNGEIWANMATLVANIMAGFELTRARRRAFLSYKRHESRGVAVQLHGALEWRRFTTFLDTASIEAGVSFQPALLSNLANIDLVILLHTANALNSEWVYKELVEAQKRGTEVIQVLWPGVREQDPKRTAWADLGLCEPVQLAETDLVRGAKRADDTVTPAFVHTLLPQVEQARMRSIRRRRDSVVRALADAAQHSKLTATYHPAGTPPVPMPHLVLSRPDSASAVATLVPSDGIPDSRELFRRFATQDGVVMDTTRTRLVYDELGVHPEELRHLNWLNSQLSAKSLAAQRATEWMSNLMSNL